ncbi:uncharacterized protein HMPREF1541_08124 [Cyphellophora europaea CBS 101466]|uniref:BHLH domain-containing protein n=1 Tax=Cyphellophora europaea (strain CBS 101466) TaxID=1220924 RepID=W2RN16_CYPE1|nr:uncharacterized protein HMPREF1541_08124 [Cyphellophora europaea CBS 101466]ETN37134.1 hypothetical protein HMPREF1541_08124 [Cyphellophora europaea CBS 101466]
MPQAKPRVSHDDMDHQPFGYDLSFINGIGLPQFDGYRPPPPQPPDRHLLNLSENSQLADFFTSFETTQTPLHNGHVNQSYPMEPFNHHAGFVDMPPNFVGSESILMNGNGQEVHEWQMDRFMFQNDMPHTDIHSNPGLQQPSFGPLSQPGSASAPLAPVYSTTYQQPPFQPQGQPLQTPGRGPLPNFGSDANFQANGFINVPDQANNTLQEEIWLSSNPTTRPNTQPSSPNMNRKRKSEVEHSTQRNGFVPSSHDFSSPTQAGPSLHPSRLSHVKAEPVQEPTPHSSLENNSIQDGESDADAGAESDVEYVSRPSSPPAPSSSRRVHSTKPSRSRQKGASGKKSKPISKATESRPKASRNNSQQKRQPLSLDQKKANHTSSEQRRRDATARAQARLFDLVPAVRNASQKQSTVQKLSKVVEFMPKVEAVSSAIKARLGLTGTALGSFDASGIGLSMTDATDAAAAGALAGMGAMNGTVLFDGSGGPLGRGGY